MRLAGRLSLLLPLHLAVAVVPAGGQQGVRPALPAAADAGDAFLDPGARSLHGTATGAWEQASEDIVSYTAVVRQRAAADLRLPLKDRTLYRQENASRVFWSRDGGTVIQVLGAKEWHPGYAYRDEDDDPAWENGMLDEAFDPGGERLTFGMGDDDEVWFEHPLGRDALEHYRFRSGDTLTLTLPDARRVRAVELQVLPREADVHRISGSLWVEPESGALVRAVYRLSQLIEMVGERRGGSMNVEPREEIGDDDGLGFLPGIFRPITFDLSLIAVEYALWDFRVWLPRSMRAEGMMTAGVVKVPAAVEMSYRMESVVSEGQEDTAVVAPAAPLEERHFRTRSEALAYLAELAGEPGMAFEPEDLESSRRGRQVRYLLPRDREWLARSPHLPPPIWEEAGGFPTPGQIEEMVGDLSDLPAPEVATSWAFVWGHQRPDLLRYNRVEGLSVGGRLQARVGSPVGPLSLELVPFLGLADVDPKARFSVEHETLERRTTFGLYHDLEPVGRGRRHLGLGNSVTALLFGRDEGEYFLASGAELRLGPPSAERASWEFRLYAERHRSLAAHTKVTLAHAFDGGWWFRPNIEAAEQDELGASLLLSPWWGTDPLAAQAGIELFVQGALGDVDYGRSSLQLRGVTPLFGSPLRAALELGAGESWGSPPIQRSWFLGGSANLRGYDPSVLVGPAFTRARVELGWVFPASTVSLFGDGGWAGERLDTFDSRDALFSVGVGFGVLDGLIRLDVARGLRDPKSTRWDLYLDGIL